jgi:hypothetical protein
MGCISGNQLYAVCQCDCGNHWIGDADGSSGTLQRPGDPTGQLGGGVVETKYLLNRNRRLEAL